MPTRTGRQILLNVTQKGSYRGRSDASWYIGERSYFHMLLGRFFKVPLSTEIFKHGAHGSQDEGKEENRYRYQKSDDNFNLYAT